MSFLSLFVHVQYFMVAQDFCQVLAGKGVIASWILVGYHSVRNSNGF